jgi:hypothetical protein
MTLIRKAQVIGALLGSFGSIGFLLVAGATNDPHKMLDWGTVLSIWIWLPIYHLLKLFGSEDLLTGAHLPLGLVLCGIMNGVILFLFGTAIGWLLKELKSKKLDHAS